MSKKVFVYKKTFADIVFVKDTLEEDTDEAIRTSLDSFEAVSFVWRGGNPLEVDFWTGLQIKCVSKL